MKLLSTEEALVFRCIRSHEERTKQEISEELNIPLTSLNRIMKKLLEGDWIEACKVAPSSGGRRPEVYRVSGNRYCFIGIELSRITVRVVLCNLRMEVLAAKEFQMTKGHRPEKVLELCEEMIREQIESLQRSGQGEAVDILGLGIGTVGPLDLEEGKLGKVEGFLSSGWEGYDLKKNFEEKVKLETWIDNGANTGCLAEAIYGIGKNFASLAYFQVGKGIRSAHMTQGILLRTRRNTEDAVAHMCMEKDGVLCSCGRKGCLEAYVSLDAMEMKVEQFDKEEQSEEAAKYLAMGMGNYIRLLSPEQIILTGPFFQVHPQVYGKSLALLKQDAYDQLIVAEGKFKELSMAVGAAAMVLERKVL